MKRAALASVLSKKFEDHEVKVFDGIQIEAPKTKMLNIVLRPLLGIPEKRKTLDVLLVPSVENKDLARAGANLPKTKVISPKSLNVQDLLNYKNIFIEEKAIPEMRSHFEK